jgi:hypothetical protein
MSMFNRQGVSSRLKALAIAAVIGGAALAATPAEAWWHGGVFIGLPPVVVAPAPYPYPYYYPPYYYPPAYYPPYPYAYPPPPADAPAQPHSNAAPGNASSGSGKVAYGATCYAGVYHCAAPAYTPIGETCSCPGIGAPSYGSAQ